MSRKLDGRTLSGGISVLKSSPLAERMKEDQKREKAEWDRKEESAQKSNAADDSSEESERDDAEGDRSEDEMFVFEEDRPDTAVAAASASINNQNQASSRK